MERQIDTVKNAIHELREAFMHFSAAFDRSLKGLDQAVQYLEHEQRAAEDADDDEE